MGSDRRSIEGIGEILLIDPSGADTTATRTPLSIMPLDKEEVEKAFRTVDCALDKGSLKQDDAVVKDVLQRFYALASDDEFVTFCDQNPEFNDKLDELKERRDKFLKENQDSKALQSLMSEWAKEDESEETAPEGTESSGTS